MYRINDETWFKNKYEVDEVHFNDQLTIRSYLQKINAKKVLLLVSYILYKAENTDSGNTLEPANFNGKDSYFYSRSYYMLIISY
uniref:Uncharacterized protein n=1 Tax=Heterorhabditis bacteriophora TaxID=37862 RepID=A0A1I7WY79_HETBA